MSTPLRASDRDLRALAAIVSQDRPDLPGGEGLPPSLLADLMDQIRCDSVSLERLDSGPRRNWWLQSIPAPSADQLKAFENQDPAQREHFYAIHLDCQTCGYPERTGDLHSVVTTADFYSARQWHSTPMYCDCLRPDGYEHQIHLCLPDPAGPGAGPGRTVRLFFFRGPGLDFSERDRALLVLLRPHLYQALLDAERRRHPVPRFTPRQNDLLRLLAAGHTNTQIARRLGISEGTVRTHLENIYEKLHVSSRTAAVTHAFPDQAAFRLRQCEGVSWSCPSLHPGTRPLPSCGASGSGEADRMRRPQGDLDTAASSRTPKREAGGRGQQRSAQRISQPDRCYQWVARRALGRPPKAEPGAEQADAVVQ
jgi:DNA-binding CsgD family transcriptional regulator